jgi:hypothetical protein
MQTDRILVGVLLLVGFLWLRFRARKLDESGRSRAYKGILLFLIPVLLSKPLTFDRLPFGRWENFAIEAGALAAAIALAGFVFMVPAKKTEENSGTES